MSGFNFSFQPPSGAGKAVAAWDEERAPPRLTFGQRQEQHGRPLLENLEARRQQHLHEEVSDYHQSELLKARQDAAAARADYEELQAQHLHCNLSDDDPFPNMVDEEVHYEALRSAAGHLEDLRKTISELKETNKQLTSDITAKDEELEERDDHAEQLQLTVTSLRDQLASANAALQHADLQKKNDEGLLDKAYSDNESLHAALKDATAAKEQAEREHYDEALKLQSLRAQWDEDQTKIAQLEMLPAEMHSLEQHSRALQEDMHGVIEQSHEKDRLIGVKDARIQHLEIQLQRAIAGQLAAEQVRDSLQSPSHDLPMAIPVVPDSSLQSELQEVGDGGGDVEFDNSGSEYEEQHIELSGIIELATIDIPPIAAQRTFTSTSAQTQPRTTTTKSASIQTDSALATTSTSIQTDSAPATTSASAQTEILATTNSASVQTDSAPATTSTSMQTSSISTISSAPVDAQPNMQFSGVSAMDTAPVKSQPRLQLSGLTAVSTKPIAPLQDMDLFDIADEDPAPATPKTSSPAKDATHAPVESTHTVDASTQAPQQRESSEIASADLSPAEPRNIERVESTQDYVNHKNDARKRDLLFTFRDVIIVLLLTLCYYFYSNWHAWESANDLESDPIGAYGSRITVLGLPIGVDIGESRMSETIAKYMAGFVHKASDAWGGGRGLGV